MPIRGCLYAFLPGNIDNAPDDPGVYALYDGDVLVYYGSAPVSLRENLQRHYQHKDRFVRRPSGYRRETCADPLERERELLEEFRATHRRLPRCNETTG